MTDPDIDELKESTPTLGSVQVRASQQRAVIQRVLQRLPNQFTDEANSRPFSASRNPLRLQKTIDLKRFSH